MVWIGQSPAAPTQPISSLNITPSGGLSWLRWAGSVLHKQRSGALSTALERTGCALIALSFVFAVFFNGGVEPEVWQWSALGISLGSLCCILSAAGAATQIGPKGLGILYVLVGWLLLQTVPLAPWIVEHLSPVHWHAVMMARSLTGQNSSRWFALSVAPPETMRVLVDFFPAFSAFLVARKLSVRFAGPAWPLLAPVIAVACAESMLGMLQFQARRNGSLPPDSGVGTFVNRDHFVALLEIAFPIAVMWGVAILRKGHRHLPASTAPTSHVAVLLAAAACLVIGIALSLSRLGFLSMLASIGVMMFLVLNPAGGQASYGRRALQWMVPIAIPVVLLIVLPPPELLNRFANDPVGRIGIWKDAAPMVNAYKWTGSGLGTFEHAYFPFQTTMPGKTVNYAHNDYLQLLIELGVFGLVLVALLASRVVARGFAVVAVGPTEENWEFAIGLLASLAAIAVHSLGDFNLFLPANALAIAWVSGVLSAQAPSGA